jgi:predicted transcriptional regulator
MDRGYQHPGVPLLSPAPGASARAPAASTTRCRAGRARQQQARLPSPEPARHGAAAHPWRGGGPRVAVRRRLQYNSRGVYGTAFLRFYPEQRIMASKSITKVRLTLDVTDELNERLDQLAAEAGGSKSEFLRKAIALAEAAVAAKKDGNEVAIVNKNSKKVVTTIVGL